MLVYLYNTHLFTGIYSRLPPPHKAHSYIQTAWEEGKRGSSKGISRSISWSSACSSSVFSWLC